MNYIQPSQWSASTDLYNNQLIVSGQDYWVLTAQRSWSVTNPSGDNSTLRFEVRPGDVWQQGDSTIVPEKNRSEIAGTTHYAMGTDIHISYGWTIEPGAANTSTWVTAGQLRQAANDPYSAPFGIMLNGEKMRINIEAGGTDPNWGNFRDLYVDSQNMIRGHEYQMQINARFDAVNGHLDVIRDGVKLVDYNGPLGWANMGSVYWKEGVYRASAPESLAMDYSHLQITTGAQSPTPSPSTIPTPSASANNLEGTAGNDVLAGQAASANHIRGYDGDDSITGGSQFNDINGNQGNDVIVGKSVVGDWLLGGQGHDSIDASAATGANIVNGNLGNDTITGGSGADTLRGGQGDDVIHAGPGAQWISGDLGTNTIYGGQGLDTFHASAGHDLVTGWHAGDRIQVDSGVTWTTSQVNADVHVAFSNGGAMDLLNTQVSSLQSGWIFNA